MDNEFNLFSLIEEENKEEPAKAKEKETAVESKVKEEAKQAKADEKPKKTAKKANKTTKKKADSESNGITFKYPFNIYSEGRIIDIDNYGFEEGQEYTEKQISDVMLQHKHYEFGGKLEFNFIEEDNVITVNAIQHKKG